MPAARFAFCLCFIRFVFVLSGKPKQNQGREFVDRSTSSSRIYKIIYNMYIFDRS